MNRQQAHIEALHCCAETIATSIMGGDFMGEYSEEDGTKVQANMEMIETSLRRRAARLETALRGNNEPA